MRIALIFTFIIRKHCANLHQGQTHHAPTGNAVIKEIPQCIKSPP